MTPTKDRLLRGHKDLAPLPQCETNLKGHSCPTAPCRIGGGLCRDRVALHLPRLPDLLPSSLAVFLLRELPGKLAHNSPSLGVSWGARLRQPCHNVCKEADSKMGMWCRWLEGGQPLACCQNSAVRLSQVVKWNGGLVEGLR